MDCRIDDELIEYIAVLAKLELSQREKEQAKKDMERMLEFMGSLKEADTGDIEPLRHIFPRCNVFREDEVVDADDREGILANAPRVRDGAFVVPAAIGLADGG